jgi:hypothetical protein
MNAEQERIAAIKFYFVGFLLCTLLRALVILWSGSWMNWMKWILAVVDGFFLAGLLLCLITPASKWFDGDGK